MPKKVSLPEKRKTTIISFCIKGLLLSLQYSYRQMSISDRLTYVVVVIAMVMMQSSEQVWIVHISNGNSVDGDGEDDDLLKREEMTS